MKTKKFFYLLASLMIITVLLGIIGIFFGDKLLSKKSNNIYNLRLKEQILLKQQAELTDSKQEISKYSSLNQIAETIVPHEKDQALTVREIASFASNAGIQLSSITFPASSLGSGVAGSTSPSGSTSGTSSPTGTTSKTPSQLQAAKGLPGIYIMPITVQSNTNSPISYTQLLNFLKELENNRHTAEVSQLTITPATKGSGLTFTIVVNIYIKK